MDAVAVPGFFAPGRNPSTLLALEKNIFFVRRLKVERPGKGATVTICDTLEGPIVRLKDGSVVKITTEEEARQHNPYIEEVVFLGDIMFNYGDFSENGHYLAPAGYCPEWWALEVEKALETKYQGKIHQAAQELNMEETLLQKYISSPLFDLPSFEEAFAISKNLAVPLHPEYTYYWKL